MKNKTLDFIDGDTALHVTPNVVTAFKKRIITIGNIKTGALTPQIVTLYDMASQSDQPIIIFIRSAGGDLEESMLFRDALLTVKTPIITLAFDSCMSAGMIIFCTGQIRSSFEFTKFMTHKIKISDISMDSDELRKEATQIDKENKVMFNIIAKSSLRKPSWWVDKVKKANYKDYYFDSEFAKKIGIVNGPIFGTENKFDFNTLCSII